MNAFRAIPFFRILIPFVGGILLGILAHLPDLSFWCLPALLAPLIVAAVMKRTTDLYKWLFMIVADACLLVLGLLLVQHRDLQRHAGHYGRLVNTDSIVTFIATVNDLPAEKERFVRCELKLQEVKTGTTFREALGIVPAYFKRGAATRKLQAGQTLLVKARLSDIQPPKNPFEFDYRNYLQNRQIYHTAFVDTGAFAILPVKSRLSTLWQFGLDCKDYILATLKASDLSRNAYGICAALLTGYDDDIDKPVMEAFSHSGTLHVLSVSGLHTGLIYLALNFLFNLADPGNRYKLSRFIMITLVLWLFALVTGFSAPVLRAVIMFNLLGFGKIYFRARYSHQVNILLFSAFILLSFNPFYIMDIGFLLSYFALFGLLYFQPRLSGIWQPGNTVLNAVWQSTTASVAATLSTLPFTLICFKQFPLWFFVCNVVVVPVTFILLLLALLLLCKIGPAGLLINYLVAFLIWFIELFNIQGTGFIDAIHFEWVDLLFLSSILLLGALAFQYRSYRLVVQSCLLLIAWQIVSLFSSWHAKQRSFLAVYHVKQASAAALKNKTQVYLTAIDPFAYSFNVKPHLVSCNYPLVSTADFNCVKATGTTVLFLKKPGYWPRVSYDSVTTLVLCNNFRLTGQDLVRFRNLKSIILDASNNSHVTATAEELSRNFGIRFYSTRYQGAFLLAL